MSVAVRFDERDLRRILGKLGPELIEGPKRKFLTRAAIYVQGQARLRAPVDTGRLRSSLAYEVDSANPPLWAKVGTNVLHQGVSYPRILDESERRHYRGGPRAGQPTKGWLSGVLGKRTTRNKIQGFLRDMGDAIRRIWNRRF